MLLSGEIWKDNYDAVFPAGERYKLCVLRSIFLYTLIHEIVSVGSNLVQTDILSNSVSYFNYG